MEWLAEGDNNTLSAGRQTGDHLATTTWRKKTISDKKRTIIDK